MELLATWSITHRPTHPAEFVQVALHPAGEPAAGDVGDDLVIRPPRRERAVDDEVFIQVAGPGSNLAGSTKGVSNPRESFAGVSVRVQHTHGGVERMDDAGRP